MYVFPPISYLQKYEIVTILEQYFVLIYYITFQIKHYKVCGCKITVKMFEKYE